MKNEVAFFVPGLPAPGGSKRGFAIKGRVILADACKRTKPWQAVVSAYAQDAWGNRPILTGPVDVEMTFTRPTWRTPRRSPDPASQ